MEIVIKHQRSFRNIQSIGSPNVATPGFAVPGFAEESWIIADQGNKFEFLRVGDELVLTKCTIFSSPSVGFGAFISYLDLFYDISIDDIGNLKGIK